MNTAKSNGEGWVMGFLLLLFPEHHDQETHRNIITLKNSINFDLFSPSSSDSISLNHKAQSTISICLLLVFTTLLLFAVSTLPSAVTARRLYGPVRRHLREFHHPLPSDSPPPFNLPHALQGMGNLYRRGTTAMNDVVVAHAPESLSVNELKLFLRLFLRSNLASNSDLLLIFHSTTSDFDSLIVHELDAFFNLLTRYRSSNDSSSFDVTHFVKTGKKERERGEPIWGRKIRTNHREEGETGSTQSSYGSVVGFDVDELDPENSLSGFLVRVPISLRRWACYPMLLGRVRRNFKHVMLVDMKDILLLGDPLGRVRHHSPESVFLKGINQTNSGKHGKRNSEETESPRRNSVHPGLVMGGSRGVRGLSNVMLTAIVRALMRHNSKKKNSMAAESNILSRLVANGHALKNVNLIVSNGLLSEISTLRELGSSSGSSTFSGNNGFIVRDHSKLDVVNSMLMKHVCSFPIDSTVYSDC